MNNKIMISMDKSEMGEKIRIESGNRMEVKK